MKVLSERGRKRTSEKVRTCEHDLENGWVMTWVEGSYSPGVKVHASAHAGNCRVHRSDSEYVAYRLNPYRYVGKFPSANEAMESFKTLED